MAQAARQVDRRRARTRSALLRAGAALFATRPVDAVSIDEIVAAADVAKGSFYNHFEDKEALARAIAEEVRGGVEALAAEVNAGVPDPAERVARALCGFVRQAAEQPVAVRAMVRLFQGAAVPDAPMNRGVRADIKAGLAAGRFDGVALETGVLMAVGVVQMAVSRALEGKSGKPAALAADLAFGLLRGLGLKADEAKAIAERAAADVLTRS